MASASVLDCSSMLAPACCHGVKTAYNSTLYMFVRFMHVLGAKLGSSLQYYQVDTITFSWLLKNYKEKHLKINLTGIHYILEKIFLNLKKKTKNKTLTKINWSSLTNCSSHKSICATRIKESWTYMSNTNHSGVIIQTCMQVYSL